MIDDELRELLSTKADEMELPPDAPTPVLRRARRRRGRNGALAGLMAVAVVAGAVVGGRALIHDLASVDRPAGSVTPTSGRTPPSSRAPGETSSPSASEPTIYPSTFVGVKDGAIVLIESASGSVIRELVPAQVASGNPDGNPPMSLTRAPDFSTVYFTPHYEGSERPRLMSVDVESGRVTEVIEGSAAAVSPDGRWLAYAGCDAANCGQVLVVRDLSTGEERHWTRSGAPEVSLGALAWVDDSLHLGYSVFFPGDSNPQVFVLPTDAPEGSLDDREPIGPADHSAGWTAAGWSRTGPGLAVREYCCGLNPDRYRVVAVNPDAGDVTATLLEGLVLRVAADASGRNLIFIAPDGAVYRWTDGQTVKMAQGLQDVSW
jgi:hypothetical protein